MRYQIDVDLDHNQHRLVGKMRLEYTNHSPDALDEIFMHLYWNAFQPGSMMSNMANIPTQFKDKAGKDRENASVGLLDYPVLMAADILIYRATHVPVGDDQKQHLELARDIAQKFNNDFGASIERNGFGEAFFPLPEPLISGPATRLMSLRDGTKKMSKSDPSDYSRINLTDDADGIAQKVRKAKTDPEPLPDRKSVV